MEEEIQFFHGGRE